MSSARKITLTLTQLQYEAIAAAVGEHEMTLEDQKNWRDRAVLVRAWNKIRSAWYANHNI